MFVNLCTVLSAVRGTCCKGKKPLTPTPFKSEMRGVLYCAALVWFLKYELNKSQDKNLCTIFVQTRYFVFEHANKSSLRILLFTYINTKDLIWTNIVRRFLSWDLFRYPFQKPYKRSTIEHYARIFRFKWYWSWGLLVFTICASHCTAHSTGFCLFNLIPSVFFHSFATLISVLVSSL